MRKPARETRFLAIFFFFVQLSRRRKLVRRVNRQNEIMIPDGLKRSIWYETLVLTAGQPESFNISFYSMILVYSAENLALQTRRKSLTIPMGETFFATKRRLITTRRYAYHCVKTSLTFKCLIEHLLADFSYSRPLDTYLWKQMMKINRNITYKWCNIAKKHLLFTKRKCHKFSWLFTASHYSPRRRSICACRIAC